MFYLVSAVSIFACFSTISYVELAPMLDIPELRTRYARSVIIDKSKRWPLKIPYEIDLNVGKGMRRMIKDALGDFKNHTCLSFHPATKKDKNYLSFTDDDKGCNTMIGRVGGKHVIHLSDNCLSRTTILHEVLHALGFEHEHVRFDRDKYVSINYSNIEKGLDHNFQKEDPKEFDTQGLPYDFNSLMHYSSNTFSKNGLPTINAKNSKNANWKRGQNFSKTDIERINRAYCKNVDLKTKTTSSQNSKWRETEDQFLDLEQWELDFLKD